MAKPGVKKGGPNPGGFKKGADPRRNRGGNFKTKQKRDFYAECRYYSVSALTYLAELVQDDEAATGERRKAAEFIIEQARGKAVDRVVLQSVGDGGNVSNVKALTRSELADRAAHFLESQSLGEVIDGEVISGGEPERIAGSSSSGITRENPAEPHADA